MTQEELFIKNLSFVENLEMQQINCLIGKYIFKTQVKLYKMHYEVGQMRSKTVAVSKIETNPSQLQRAVRARKKPRTYTAQAAYFDTKVWQRTADWGFSSIEVVALLEVLSDYRFFVTFDDGKTIYTFFNKYQISGTFPAATAKAIILMYSIKNFLDFENEDLHFLIPEDLYVPKQEKCKIQRIKKETADDEYPSRYGKESAKDGTLLRRAGALRGPRWVEKHPTETQRFTVEED